MKSFPKIPMKQSLSRLLLFSSTCIGAAILLIVTPQAQAQTRPYIGYAYPAGGQQGQTFEVRVGGQGLDYVEGVTITGTGVTAKVSDYLRRLNNQEMAMLQEQLRELKEAAKAKEKEAEKVAKAAGEKPKEGGDAMMNASMMDASMMAGGNAGTGQASTVGNTPEQKMQAAIEKRIANFQQTLACASLSSFAFVEVTVAPDAEPGLREIRIVTARGVSNPLVFEIGQLPETSRPAMAPSVKQILGKEYLAMRKRPPEEKEVSLTIPCTANGQIASGEINSYRFSAKKGQRLVLNVRARTLIPFIADAVPGWFQPVIALYNAKGREVAYQDDFQFHPDPVLFYDVPEDGEYVATIFDSIHRGREDFIYRLSIGETPFLTSIFPLGGKAGALPSITFKGRNIDGAAGKAPAKEAAAGINSFAAVQKGIVSNQLPFAIDTLPESVEAEPNDAHANAQVLTSTVIVNGRIDKSGDRDIYKVQGKAGETLVAEIHARKLESPTDAVLTLTDASGKILAYSDDLPDVGAGTNTHHADPMFSVKLPADGDYFVQVSEANRQGGEDYGYRLRVGAPQPDFELRFIPSSVVLKSKGAAVVTVQAIRRDGFTDPIQITLKNPPEGFTAAPVNIAANQTTARLTIKTELEETKGAIDLTLQGTAKIADKDVVREAIAAEDEMQAFLWKQLVPTLDFKAQVVNLEKEPAVKRKAPERPPLPEENPDAVAKAGADDGKPKFSRKQIEGRLRELKRLYEDELLTDSFYIRKVEECEASAL